MSPIYVIVIVQVFLIQLTSSQFLRGATAAKYSAKCETEGALLDMTMLSLTPCVKCYCKKGQIVCEKNQCRATKGCHMLMFHRPKGACCDVCKGCWHNGTFHESDSTWADPNNPCESFTCKAGVVTASTSQCYVPCKNPVRVPGQCCPVCNQCSLDGVSYSNGQRFTPKADKCVTCECKDGNVHCSKPACPVLNCPDRLIYTPDGACCPVCQGSRKVFDLPRRCLFRHKVYSTGQTVDVDKCTRCSCEEGTTMCRRKTCPSLSCPPDHVIHDSSSCCPRCKVSTTLSCHVDRITYKHGEVWQKDVCTSCSCYDGDVTCESQQCSNSLQCPNNHHLAPVAGECCPRCVEDDAVCSVFGDPHYRTFDGRLFTFQGTCKYILSRDCAGSNFTVSVRNQNRFKRPFAWTKSVSIELIGHKIILQSRHVVKVLGKRVKLPFVESGVFSIESEGHRVTLRANNGLTVSWNGDSFLELSVPPTFKNRLCGLCGNYNGVERDDITGKDGKPHYDSVSFGNSWRHGSKKSCGKKKSVRSRENPLCQSSFSKWRRAHKQCSAIKSRLFAECGKQVDVRSFYDACLTDVCNCPKKHSCECDSITAYGHVCKQAGFPVNWSRLSKCPVY